VRYDLEGQLGEGVSTKDVFLYIAGTYGDHANQNVEFGGAALPYLSIDARRTLTTMGAELSAEFATFEPDEVLIDYVKARSPAPFEPQYPDADAMYVARRAIDLSTLSPMVALPDRVIRNAVPVDEAAGEPIQQAFIGSCANGTLDDLPEAARVLKGRHVAAARDAGVAAHRRRGGQGRVCADAARRRRRGDPSDLRRLLWRPYGCPRPRRDLHHRLDPQFQRPDGRRDGAHLHGLAGDGRRLGGRRPYRPPRQRLAVQCHCERSEAIPIRLGAPGGRLLRRSAPRNDKHLTQGVEAEW